MMESGRLEDTTPSRGGPKGHNKSRRWSLDIISPFFQAKSKRVRAGLSHSLPSHLALHPRLSLTSVSAGDLGQLSLSGVALQRRPWAVWDHESYIVVHEKDEHSYVVSVAEEGELRTLVETARMEKKEERVSSYRVIVTATRQSRSSSDSSPPPCLSQEQLLQQMQNHLQAVAEHSAATDDRLTLVTELLHSEQQFCDNLQTLYEQYAEPLRKFSSLSAEHHLTLFVGVEPVFKQSAALIEKLGNAVNNGWDGDTTRIGDFFTNRFWKIFDDYNDNFERARLFLADRLKADKALGDFCQLRESSGVLPLHHLLFLPVKRIPEYDKYLNDLLDETDSSHPDFEELSRAANRVRTMLKEREEEEKEAENDIRMESVQGRFPFDDLQLRDQDKAQTKPRGLSLRRRSAPSAVVFRSVSGGRSRSSSGLWSQGAMGRKDQDTFSAIRQAADTSRLYVMEGPVQFAMGMQTQDRYLFLFSDLLLVAKQKNSTMFKLKFRVPLCDVWLTTCVDEVTELTRPLDRSFVLGWPTCNMVATFRDAVLKEKWLTKLTELVQGEKQRVDLREIALRVVFRDDSKTESCQLMVGNTQQAKDVLRSCFDRFNIPESESKDHTLWVSSGKEGSKYPLIGHETPFSIKVSHLREAARGHAEDSTMTLAQLSSTVGDDPTKLKCEFILTHKKSTKKHSLDEASHKSMKKSKKSYPLLNIFKRSGRDYKVNITPPAPSGELFGRPLATVCQSDNSPPKPIFDFLTILHREGIKVEGILRKTASMKACRELQEQLDQGQWEGADDAHAVLAGGVLKEFLRKLPEPLLQEELYEEWLKVVKLTDVEEKVQHIRGLLSQMPECNVVLLKLILCALHNIQRHSEKNKMNSYNLSLCIAPSMLWHRDHVDLSSGAPPVEFMIDHCVDIFSPSILHLLEEPKCKDYGTDSDSNHSILSMPDTGNTDSIDSLVQSDLYSGEGEMGEEESNSTLAMSHLSPSNLSRDSGLTLSDTQLYDDDCKDDSDPRLTRGYHRGGMHYTERDDYESDSNHIDAPHNPIPPPRKRGKKHSHDNDDRTSQTVLAAGMRSRNKRYTLHSSVSSSQLLDHLPRKLSASVNTDSLRPALTHPSFSSMSDDYEQQPIEHQDLQQYSKSTDIGLLRKSASGAHLILDDETLPRKYSETSLGGIVFRQSSAADSTPPLSPQSRYSSSRDSVISDMSNSAMSRESSITSAPQTPDDDRLPPWLPAHELDSEGHHRLTKSHNQMPQRAGTESTGVDSGYTLGYPPSVQKVQYLVSPPDSPVHELENQDFLPFSTSSSGQPSVSRKSRSYEAEDVSPSSSPRIYITQSSSISNEKLDEAGREEVTPRPSPSSSTDAFPLEIPHTHGHASMPVKQMIKYSQSLAKGSPPPRVLLQSLRSPRSGKDPAPVRASHDSNIVAQVQRAGSTPAGGEGAVDTEAATAHFPSQGYSGVHTSDGSARYSSKGFDAARSMEDAINDTEYISVKPKLTIIRREESIHSNVSTYSSGSEGSVGKDSVSSAGSAGKSSLSSVTLSTSPSTHSSSSSSSGSSNITLSGEHSRPSKPPDYNEAVQRSLLLKQDTSVDPEVLAQKEASQKARDLYEDSVQMYQQVRYDQKHARHKTSDTGAEDTPSSGGTVQSEPNSNSLRSVSPSSGDLSSNGDMHMAMASHTTVNKDPRQIYLESLQRYEQQQTNYVKVSEPRPDSIETKKSVRSVKKSSRVDGGSQFSDAGNALTHRNESTGLVRLREKRTDMVGDVRPRSMLDLPFSNLHRSHSDSAERLNKVGLQRPRGQPGVTKETDPKQSVTRVVSDDSKLLPQSPRRKVSETAIYEQRGRSDSNPADMFRRTSHFYPPSDLPRSGRLSPTPQSHRPQSPKQGAQLQSFQGEGSLTHSSKTNVSVTSKRTDHSVMVPSRVDSTVPRPARSSSPVLRQPRAPITNVNPTIAASCPALPTDSSQSKTDSAADKDSAAATPTSADSKRKSQLGWSVKNLMKLYDAENTSHAQHSVHDPSKSAMSSSGARPGPPPYQDPPPFHRLQDKTRLSTSSSSSNSSSSTGCSTARGSTHGMRRLGPQSAITDCTFSEELSFTNSRQSPVRSEGGNSMSEQEATNPYTDIFYI